MKQKLLQKLLAILFAITLVTINIIRIFNIPITHDETGYGPGSYWRIMTADHTGANNHILHTVLRKFFIELFGSDSLFFYRLDSLLALIMFLAFSWLICKLLFKNGWWLLLAFILLNVASPLIFNFWGLSRGYALALSFMTVSIYYFLRYLETHKTSMLALSLLTAILTVYSNFGYINYYVAICGAVVLQRLLFRGADWKRVFIKELGVVFAASAILAVLIITPLKNIASGGEMAYLGTNGFIADTITSLVADGLFIPNAETSTIDIIKWSVVGITLVLLPVWAFIYVKKSNRELPGTKYGVALFLLLIIPVISMFAQFHLYGINYLVDRAALFFIMLFCLNLVNGVYLLFDISRMVGLAIIGVVFILANFNFWSKMNTTAARLWWYDSEDLLVLKKIDELHKKPGKIRMWVYWLSVPAMRYDTEHYYKGRYHEIEGTSGSPTADTAYDFYFIPTSEAEHISDRYQRVADFIGGGFCLYQKKTN